MILFTAVAVSQQDTVFQYYKGSSDIKKIALAIKQTIRYKLIPHLFVMIGSPGETRQTLNSTLAFIRRFPADKIKVSYGLLYPYPETYIWQKGQAAHKLKDWADVAVWAGTIDNDFTPRSIRRAQARFALGLLNWRLKYQRPWPALKNWLRHYPRLWWQTIQPSLN